MSVSKIVIERNVDVPMRDGVVLAADVYRPADDEPAPTLITRTPYGKGFAHYISSGNFPLPLKLAEEGYAVVVNDIRGRWDSGGEFVPYVHDGPDGYDTVEWAAGQPWSNGRTGVFGCSYLGLTTLLAAREAPPSLKCAIAMVAPANPFLEMSNGARLVWLLAQAVSNLERPDHGVPESSQRALFEALAQESYRRPWRPLETAPGISAPQVAPYFQEMIRHDSFDAYWEAASPDSDYGAYSVPILHMGGWWDGFNIGTVRNFRGISAATDHPQHLWMGPWGHQEYERIYGEYDFGGSAAIGVPRRGGGGIMRAYLDFLDLHLRGGSSTPARVTYFLMGANEWRQTESWPPPGSSVQPFYLHSQGRANTSGGDGRLDRDPPSADEEADRYIFDPENPVSTQDGPRISLELPGPQDHQWLEQRPDVLCYTTAEFERPFCVAGTISLELWAITDAPDTDWTAKLLDVFPDGRSVRLRWGHLSARFRESIRTPKPVISGEPTRYTLELGSIAYRIPVGHRLRLEISSSDWPAHPPNPNTGEPQATAAATKIAHQQILHTVSQPSTLRLPILAE